MSEGDRQNRVLKFLKENWERILFSIFGLSLIGFAFHRIVQDKIAESGMLFGLGFFSFIYANVSRFKRFKGFGFEAELWEDKQKEASELIERLREVVAIYTREIILAKVTSGRWGSGVSWEDRWKLYDDLISQHKTLGHKIDFSDVKKISDEYFLFDMTWPEYDKIRRAILEGKRKANEVIEHEFGSPISDVAGHKLRMDQYRLISEEVDNPLETNTEFNFANACLSAWEDAKSRLKKDFNVEVADKIDPQTIKKLLVISRAYDERPVAVTPELIEWADQGE